MEAVGRRRCLGHSCSHSGARGLHRHRGAPPRSDVRTPHQPHRDGVVVAVTGASFRPPRIVRQDPLEQGDAPYRGTGLLSLPPAPTPAGHITETLVWPCDSMFSMLALFERPYAAGTTVHARTNLLR